MAVRLSRQKFDPTLQLLGTLEFTPKVTFFFACPCMLHIEIQRLTLENFEYFSIKHQEDSSLKKLTNQLSHVAKMFSNDFFSAH